MFKWFSQRAGRKNQKTRQLWAKEFNIVKEGLAEEQVATFVDNLIAQHKASQQASSASLRSLIKQAVTDAEQIAASIKAKAQAEAEAEAATIISQAKQASQEIKGRAEIATQKEAEDILAVANRKAEITEVEARQKALLFLLRAREEIEKEVRGRYKSVYARLSSSLQDLMNEGQNIEMELKSERAQLWEGKNFELKENEAALLKTAEEATFPPETLASTETEEVIEQPTQLQEEAPEEVIEQPTQIKEEVAEEVIEQPTQIKEEVAEEVIEQPVQIKEEVAEEVIEQPVQIKLDSETIYTGEVELAIAIPVELKMVTKLYNFLQTIPEIKILHTRGSWDRGTTITVVLDNPIPLISIVSKVPDVEVTAELVEKDSVAKGASSSLRRAGKKGVNRIKLTLTEGQSL